MDECFTSMAFQSKSFCGYSENITVLLETHDVMMHVLWVIFGGSGHNYKTSIFAHSNLAP